MRKVVRRVIGEGAAARHRIETGIVTLAVALALLTGIGQRIIDSQENLVNADRLAAMSLVMSGVPANATPVTFLDVDDRTRVAWGATGATPHGALAVLAGLAASSGAAAIVVDFDLAAAGPAADAQLAKLLSDYPAAAPVLMLARRIQFVRGDGAPVQAASAQATPYDAVAAGKPNIRWITTLNDIGGDRTVRRIRLWQSVCAGAAGTAYPAAALVIAALPGAGQDRMAELDSFLAGRVASECGHATEPHHGWPPVPGAAVQLPYVIPGSAVAPNLFRIAVEGRETTALRHVGAGLLVDVVAGVAKPAGEIDRDPFAGRVVLLGASYTDSGDIYRTPLGSMPGALIVANSLVQARAIVETAPASPWLKNLIAMLLFLFLAYVARTLVAVVAVIVLCLAVVLALFAVSRWLGFTAGIEVIAVAVPGFALFKLIDSLRLIAASVPTKGWRALLKP